LFPSDLSPGAASFTAGAEDAVRARSAARADRAGLSCERLDPLPRDGEVAVPVELLVEDA
jgi:hypothetical protein